MKHLPIQNIHYQQLEQGFKEWLDTLGYAEPTVKTFPVLIREFLYFLEQNQVSQISLVKPRHVDGFIQYIAKRSNKRYGGGLSTSTINKTIQAVNTFAAYLNQTGVHILDSAKRLAPEVEERTILTVQEIKQLYEATFLLSVRKNTIAIGQRDRAIIAIFYGCGLRKLEGTNLNLSDIDLVRKKVFVRRGKGNRQRYVPIAEKHAEDLKAYIQEGREWFLQNHEQRDTKQRLTPKDQSYSDALFLNQEGKRMKSFYKRFEYLKEKAGMDKTFSTHSLRHSIATHLLQSGMPIEEIAKFLGHTSLESTQIYTHIVQQLKSQTTNESE